MEVRYYRRKKRNREVDYQRLETVKDLFDWTYLELAEMLGVSYAQLCNWRRCGKAPLPNYVAMRDSLLVQCDEEWTEKRKKIMSLFGEE